MAEEPKIDSPEYSHWIVEYYHRLRYMVPYDILSGCTVGILAVPQCMAFAELAGLSPADGLYSASIAPLAYILLGSSPWLIIGPTSILAVLLASVPHRITTTFFMGVFAILLGFTPIGQIFPKLASPVVVDGFTLSAAATIMSTQIPAFLGASFKGSSVLKIIEGAFDTTLSVPTTIWGLCVLAFLFIASRVKSQFSASVSVLLATIVSIAIMSQKAFDVKTVGIVPPVIPAPHFELKFDQIGHTLYSAIMATLIAFIEGISIAYVFHRKFESDPNQLITMKKPLKPSLELRAIGVCNLVASCFNGFAVTGSFSRTALNTAAGARSPLANLFASMIVIISIFAFGPLFRFLPKATLAAVVIIAVSRMINFDLIVRLFKQKTLNSRLEILVWLSTVIGVLTLGIEIGLGIGIGANLLYHSIFLSEQHQMIITSDDSGNFVIEWCGNLIYSNVNELVLKMESNFDNNQAVILDCKSVSVVDIHASCILKSLRLKYPRLQFIGHEKLKHSLFESSFDAA